MPKIIDCPLCLEPMELTDDSKFFYAEYHCTTNDCLLKSMQIWRVRISLKDAMTEYKEAINKEAEAELYEQQD